MNRLLAFLGLAMVLVFFVACETALPPTPTPEPSPEPEPKVSVYTDEYISFEYPSSVQILVRDANEGGFARMLEFQMVNETSGLASSVGVTLQFPYDLGVTQLYDSMEELKAYYEDRPDVLKLEDLEVGGREGVLVEASGLGANSYIDVFVPVADDFSHANGENYVYHFTRDGLTIYPEETEQLLRKILDTLEFQ